MDPRFAAEVISAMHLFYSGEARESPVTGDVYQLSIAGWDPFMSDDTRPIVLHRGRPTRHALVLVHALEGTPGEIRTLATEMAVAEADLTIVLPSLAAAGAAAVPDRRPALDHALSLACRIGGSVSVGAVSSGAALAVDALLRNGHRIGGSLLLFSPLFARPPASGSRQERPWQPTDAEGEPDFASGPSRAFPLPGRLDPHELVAEPGALDAALRRALGANATGRIFLAHSASDELAPLASLPAILREAADRFILPGEIGVSHRGLVRKASGGSAPVASFNPLFDQMIAQVSQHFDRRLSREGQPHSGDFSRTEETENPTNQEKHSHLHEESAEPGADTKQDDYTRLLLDAQSAKGTDPDEVRKVVRFANRAKDLRE